MLNNLFGNKNNKDDKDNKSNTTAQGSGGLNSLKNQKNESTKVDTINEKTVKDAIKVLVKNGVINSASSDTWNQSYNNLQYLDMLLINISNKLSENKKATNSIPVGAMELKDAVDILVKKGVITTAEYWINNADKIPGLDTLIINTAKKLSQQ